MLRILRPPHSLRTAHDTLCEKTGLGLTRNGVSCSVHDLWPEFWVRHLYESRIPFRGRLFSSIIAFPVFRRCCRDLSDEDVAWISGPALFNQADPWVCQRLVRKGIGYIFHMLDDWFSISHLRPIAEARIALAHLVVVPTLSLRQRVLEHFPGANVEVLEEPIDIERVLPVADRHPRQPPMIVWCGGPYSQKEMDEFGSILKMVHARVPFRLRIVTGHSRPKIDLPVDWEWMPYDYKYEAEQLGGAVAGLAPLQDSPYARCKGTYKVKTYLACGIPPVASPIGHSLKLIRHGENGFFASNIEEWVEILVKLLTDRELVTKVSHEARRDAVEKYSHEALMPVWAERLRHHFPQLGGRD